VTTFYSLDGSTWTQTGSINYSSAPATASVGMFLINNWQNNPASADFDFFSNEQSCTTPATTQVFLPLVVMNYEPVPPRIVFAVAYLDATPIYDPDQHQALLISNLVQASTWHGYTGQGGNPQLVFNTYGGSVIKVFEPPPYRAENGKFDYAAVYQRFDLCNKIQAGLVDEVWVWESGTGNAWEWVTTGPTWSWTNDANVPNCGRTITSMNLNYQREIDVALESFGHRLEGLFMTTFPCEFYTATWPWTGWPSRCAGLVSDRYGFVARPFSGNNYVGVCGDVHHPPNILDNREYIYADLTMAQSMCKDWQQDGTAVPSTFNCTEWGCTERGYMIWWMQNLPGAGNNNHDRNGNPMPNWWSYLFR